jgi:hypothetical protein
MWLFLFPLADLGPTSAEGGKLRLWPTDCVNKVLLEHSPVIHVHVGSAAFGT